MQWSLRNRSVTSKADSEKDTTIWPFNKTKNYNDIKKKGESYGNSSILSLFLCVV